MFNATIALRTTIGSCLLLGAALAATPAQAGFLGATVNVKALFPDTSTIEVDGGNAVVTGAVEYAAGTFAG